MKTALLSHHKAFCKVQNCFCRSFILMKTEKYSTPNKTKGIRLFNQSEAKLISLVGSIYEQYLQKYPKSYRLNLSYSYFLMNFVGNILKSITYLIIASQLALGPRQTYFVLKQMYEVSSYMNEMNVGSDEPNNVFELSKAVEINENFEELLKIFEKALIKNTQFFAELCLESIDQLKILSTIDEMHFLNSSVNKVFHLITKETSNHLGTLIVYGLFQKIILN